MKAELAIVVLTAIFHAVFITAVVLSFGWDAMTPIVGVAIVATSVSIAVIAVRFSQDDA